MPFGPTKSTMTLSLLGAAAICNFRGGERAPGLLFTGIAVYSAMTVVRFIQQLAGQMIIGNLPSDDCERFIKETFYNRDICLSDGKTMRSEAAKLTGRCLPDGTEEIAVCLPMMDHRKRPSIKGATNLTQADQQYEFAVLDYLFGRANPFQEMIRRCHLIG